MSLLVSMLVDNGVVRVGTPSVQSPPMGVPARLLLIAGGRYCGIGLQVNTDGYGTIVLDLDGTVVAERWVDCGYVRRGRRRHLLRTERPVAWAGTAAGRPRIHRDGYRTALPGLVTDDMRLLMARNLGWEQLDLKRFDVVRRLDATAGNEANMAALAQIPGYAMHREDDGIVDPNASFICRPRTSASAARWSVADMWRSATMDSAGNSATCRWSCGVLGDLCRPQGDGGVRGHRQRVGGRAARVDQRADRTVA